MRISDWISDVCSSYLFQDPPLGLRPARLHRVLGRLVDANPHVNPPLPVHAARVGTARRRFGRGGRLRTAGPLDRTSVVSGNGGAVRDDLGGVRTLKKHNQKQTTYNTTRNTT